MTHFKNTYAYPVSLKFELPTDRRPIYAGRELSDTYLLSGKLLSGKNIRTFIHTVQEKCEGKKHIRHELPAAINRYGRVCPRAVGQYRYLNTQHIQVIYHRSN
jgi:hypothetical protein